MVTGQNIPEIISPVKISLRKYILLYENIFQQKLFFNINIKIIYTTTIIILYYTLKI